jgi:hypothetical protein
LRRARGELAAPSVYDTWIARSLDCTAARARGLRLAACAQSAVASARPAAGAHSGGEHAIIVVALGGRVPVGNATRLHDGQGP